MIPYKADDVADPTDALPVVTIGLIAVNFPVFFYELALGTQGTQLDGLGSHLPGVGASGAISGVLAAYLRLYPGSRIRTLIPFGVFLLRTNVPAWAFIVGWFVLQLVYGVGSISDVNAGGFLAGLLLVPLFVQSTRVDRLRAFHDAGWA